MLPFRTMLTCVLLLCGPAWATEFTVDSWELDISVLPPSGSGTGDYIPGVVNPFSQSHQVEWGVSSASASYDFAWDENGGHFSIESQIAAELVSGGTNIASTYGWIKITPSVDLAFHVDATMDFNLPRHMMVVTLGTSASAYPPPQTLHYARPSHDTLFDGIGTGTLTTCEDFIMPAGQTWRLRYDMYVDTYPYYPGAEGSIGTASGSVCFSFEVLPEPSTLGLLAIGAGMLLRRRKQA